MKARRRQLVVAVTKSGECRPLFFPGDQEDRVPAALKHRIGQCDARFGLGADDGGDPTVALGTLVTATFVLQLHDRVANLAAPSSDELGLTLDERRQPQRIRRPRP